MPLLTLPANKRLPLKHLGLELDQKHRLAGPHLALPLLPTDRVRRHPRGEPSAITHALDDARRERGAVELAHLARDADVRVDERLVVDDHVLVGGVRVGALLEPVGLPPKQVRPHVDLDEVQQGDDVEGPGLRARRLAEEKQVEQLEAYRVALEVESATGTKQGMLERVDYAKRGVECRERENIPLLKILNPRHPSLRIADHLRKQIRKAGLTELGRLRPVQRSVVDGLAVGGVPEAGAVFLTTHCAAPSDACLARLSCRHVRHQRVGVSVRLFRFCFRWNEW